MTSFSERYQIVELKGVDTVLVYDTQHPSSAETVVNAIAGKSDFESALHRAVSNWVRDFSDENPSVTPSWKLFFQLGEGHLNREGIHLSPLTAPVGDLDPESELDARRHPNGKQNQEYEQLTLPIS